ncbi:hypothetical protein [Streptomyces sp. MJM1172]|uniref:hypothetical protein n=1 Tax=Streptomyces sp. MJM1172 TaxID=1703926 RepID=UPI000AD027C2|nr:hypothetical protein [Streptomyces sp. MJM1172]
MSDVHRDKEYSRDDRPPRPSPAATPRSPPVDGNFRSGPYDYVTAGAEYEIPE